MSRDHYCGFCGKAGDDVDRLLAGPCIEVCNECIDVMHGMIHERKPIFLIKPPAPERVIVPFKGK